MCGDKMIEKRKSFEIKDIASKITTGKYHIHEDRPVNKRTLRLWKKRGYNPNKIGVVHVRYPGIDHKYAFPLYFWIVS